METFAGDMQIIKEYVHYDSIYASGKMNTKFLLFIYTLKFYYSWIWIKQVVILKTKCD